MTCSKQPAANVTLGTHLPCDMFPNHSAIISLSGNIGVFPRAGNVYWYFQLAKRNIASLLKNWNRECNICIKFDFSKRFHMHIHTWLQEEVHSLKIMCRAFLRPMIRGETGPPCGNWGISSLDLKALTSNLTHIFKKWKNGSFDLNLTEHTCRSVCQSRSPKCKTCQLLFSTVNVRSCSSLCLQDPRGIWGIWGTDYKDLYFKLSLRLDLLQLQPELYLYYRVAQDSTAQQIYTKDNLFNL